jgi:hypothetical protein
MRSILIILPRDGETATSIPLSQQRERKTSSDSFNWKLLILNRYKWYDYYSYWFTAGICLSSWTLGSSLVAIGLTAGQSISAVCLGGALATMNAFFCGEAGRQHFLGYTMIDRATWGLETLSRLSSRLLQLKVDMLWSRAFVQPPELIQEVQFEFRIGLVLRQPQCS